MPFDPFLGEGSPNKSGTLLLTSLLEDQIVVFFVALVGASSFWFAPGSGVQCSAHGARAEILDGHPGAGHEKIEKSVGHGHNICSRNMGVHFLRVPLFWWFSRDTKRNSFWGVVNRIVVML